MSASSGNNSNHKSKTGDVKPGGSYNVLNINDLYRGKSLEPKPSGGVAKHGMQTIGKIKKLSLVPRPDNSPATTGGPVKEKTENRSLDSVGDSSVSISQQSGWSKQSEPTVAASDSTLNRTQATSDFYPRAQSSGPSNQSSMARSTTAPASVSAAPSPGAPWSGDAPSGPAVTATRYLNPEFPDLDSAISNPQQALLNSGPQLRPQVPPGASWNQGTASGGNQHQSGGNGANGQYGGQRVGGGQGNYSSGNGRSDQDTNVRSSVRNSDLKNVGVLSPSKIEELDKILDQASLGPDWSATQDFDYNQTLEFDHDDDFLKKKKEKEAADLELVNSDRPKVDGPHRPLFDPNDSKPHNVPNVRNQPDSRNNPIDDRSRGVKQMPRNDPPQQHQSSVNRHPETYNNNRSFKTVPQIAPRFQRQLQEQQRQAVSSSNTRNHPEGLKQQYNNYGAPQTGHFDPNLRNQDRRPAHGDPPRGDMHVLQKAESRKSDIIVKPPPIASWADAMEPETKPMKIDQVEPKKVETSAPVKAVEPSKSNEAWPRSGKRAEPTRAKPEVVKNDPKIVTPPVVSKLQTHRDDVKNDDKVIAPVAVRNAPVEKPSVEEAVVPVVKYGPPPSKPAFSNVRPSKDPVDGRRVHESKNTEPKRQIPQNQSYSNRNQQPQQQQQSDRRNQYTDSRDPNRSYRNDQRDYRDNRNDHRNENRRHDGHGSDRRTEERAPRFSKDNRVVQDDKRYSKSEKSKTAEPDTGTEIWETASENSHNDELKSDERKFGHPKDTRRHDDGRNRRDSHRDDDLTWKPEVRKDNREHRETRSYGRDQKSYERDTGSNHPQRKYSDSRSDQSYRKDVKDGGRRSSKDESNDVSSTSHQLSKMSLKDKTGHHQVEGEVSDDGFQRVDRSKKRVKTGSDKTSESETHLKKPSKFAPRTTSKSKHDQSANTKLDKLSEEAFGPKIDSKGDDRIGTNAWVKPLSQGAVTSGSEAGRSLDSANRNRNVRGPIGKLGSIEHQDSGVDICSDQPTSTASSQRSSPGEHARKAGLMTNTRTGTQTTSVTIPRTVTEHVGAEESIPPVGTIIFENRSLKSENEALNIKKRDALLMQQQQQQQSSQNQPEHRRAITGSSSFSESKAPSDGRFEIGHFSIEKVTKEDPIPSATQDLDQKIASVKKVWEEPAPVDTHVDSRSTAVVYPESSKSPPRPTMNPSLAPGYKMQAKQVAVAYPMTSSANHMTPSPPVLQPSQISSPPLDPLRQSMMGYPSHVPTPPGHMYNTQAANFYQQFGQHMYPFSGQQNTMGNAFSNVFSQGFPNMMSQQAGQYPQNDYRNTAAAVQYQMQMQKEGQMQQQTQQMSQMHQNNSFFPPNHSFYQQQQPSMQQQQGQYGGIPGSNQSYRPQQTMLPRTDNPNMSSNMVRNNNQVAPGPNMYNNQAEMFQKLLLQHQMSQAIVGRGQGNKMPSQVPNQGVPPYNAQQGYQQQQQQRPTQSHPQVASMARPIVSQSGLPMQASNTMGMNMQPQLQQMSQSGSYPQPIQRPSPAGPSANMTSQYLNKGTSNQKMSSMSKGVAPGQVRSSEDQAKMREDAIRSTQSFFASIRDPSSVDGNNSEPTSLE